MEETPMTYPELSKIKTTGFTTNHVIDDIISSARWGYTKAAFAKAHVTGNEIEKINNAAAKEGVKSPFYTIGDSNVAASEYWQKVGGR
jgi:hypothetical protein